MWGVLGFFMSFSMLIQFMISAGDTNEKRTEGKKYWGRVKRVKIDGCVFSVKSIF